MMQIRLRRLSYFYFIILASLGCRTTPNDAYLLESDEGYLEPGAQNMGVDLDPESIAAERCIENGSTEEYRLRPVDAEDSPTLHVWACIDEKFNLRNLQIDLDRGGAVSKLKPDSVNVSIPPEYIEPVRRFKDKKMSQTA